MSQTHSLNQIILGTDDNPGKHGHQVDVVCDFNTLVNQHILVMGKTGMGKTTFLRRIVGQMSRFERPPRIHVMDVHGDMLMTGASSVTFSESSPYGLNPFTVSADLHFGGVRKRCQGIIAAIKACYPIGPKQEATLRHLIVDLYAANGFYPDKPKSWSLYDGVVRKNPKHFPAMDDACRFAFAKLRQLIIGADSQSGRALEELNKTTTKLLKVNKQAAASGQNIDQNLIEQIMTLRTQALASYRDYIENLETGKELEDFIKYESKDVLRSVVERLENLKATGLFKNQPAPFDLTNPLWHYDIKALREDEKRMFVEFRLQEVFTSALERGPVNVAFGEGLRDILVIDEAHLFFNDDSQNMLNTIAKEGRKFGLGLVCASQSPTHFSDDFFANVATKIILGVDPMYWDHLVRKLKIDPKALHAIKPFKVIGVQMANKGETRTPLKMVKV